MPGLPLNSNASKNTGMPGGIESVIACVTDPLTTPRRTTALVHANVAAAINAKKPPST
jgi:hypothetical protein